MTETQSTDQIFKEMEGRFNSDKAKGMTAVYEFEITGSDPGTYHVHIDDGTANFHEGPAPDKADCTIVASSEDWAKVVSGSMNPTTAYMTGKIKVKGNIGLSMKLQQLFF